ncbi:MAG: MotA/TolQ/ExbB proton channel family protein [Candidatus Magnetomorum sp.]|nr:MotA/TolQ/ExbB proton channel family protein [Candidatus Magnetomorum sp.]
MDIATIIGMVSAFGLVLSAIMMGGPLTIFINIPSILIVVCGTFGVIMVNYPLKEVISLISVAQKVIFATGSSAQEVIKQFIEFATKARREGILSLEGDVEGVNDEFLKKGVGLAIDGLEPEAIREILEAELASLQGRHKSGADMFVAMGTFAPAMGMIGTLIGLVQMLQNMDDPSSIGPAMAVALLTTFYGSIMANMICLPFAGKLKTYSGKEATVREIVIEGVIGLANGENPRIVEQKLSVFLPPSERQSFIE